MAFLRWLCLAFFLLAGCATVYVPKQDFTKKEAMDMAQAGIDAHLYYVLNPAQRTPQTGGRDYNLLWAEYYIWIKRFIDEKYNCTEGEGK